MAYIILASFLGAGAVISYVLTKCYYEKVIEEWQSLYHRCRVEMTRIYKQKDELAQQIKDMEADK